MVERLAVTTGMPASRVRALLIFAFIKEISLFLYVNPYPADHDFCRFLSILLNNHAMEQATQLGREPDLALVLTKAKKFSLRFLLSLT